jgi:hypothetical protein
MGDLDLLIQSYMRNRWRKSMKISSYTFSDQFAHDVGEAYEHI